MTSETKACPFCAEQILAAAVKCRYCGSDLGQTAVATPTAPVNPTPVISMQHYPTTWGFLFESGPGYWKAKPLYWVGWLLGVILCIVAFPLGMMIFAFLFVAALISRADWRKNELQKAILDAGKTGQ